jgi:hypothetical protein
LERIFLETEKNLSRQIRGEKRANGNYFNVYKLFYPKDCAYYPRKYNCRYITQHLNIVCRYPNNAGLASTGKWFGLAGV